VAWTFVGVSNAAEAASGNLVLVETGITGLAEGDLLVAAISYRDTAAFTLPSGWALVATQQSSGNTSTTVSTSIGSGLMAYIVRGSSAPDLTFVRTAGDVALGRIVAYRGNTATPYDTGSANTLGANSATVTTGTITTAEHGELLVAAALVCNNENVSAFDAATSPATASGATDTTTRPTAETWIERADSITSTGADAGLAIADAIKATAGATGTLQYTATNSARHGMVVGAFKLATPAFSPVFVAKGTVDFDSAAANLTPTFPAGVLADDIAICVFASDDTTNPSFPGGWTAEAQQTTTNWSSRMAWLRCTGSESGTSITVTHAPAVVKGAQIYVFRHCIASGTPYEDYSGATGLTGPAASNATTISGTGRLVVRLTAISDDPAINTPTGYKSPLADTTLLGGDMGLYLDFKPSGLATTEASTSKATSEQWSVFDFALKPATAPSFKFNSADKSTDQDLTNSDLTATQSGDGVTRTVRTTKWFGSGKYCVTFNNITVTADGFQSCGVANSTFALDNSALGVNTLGAGFWDDATRYFNGSILSDTTGWATSDYVVYAWDEDLQLAWTNVNGGAWEPSGDPASGTGGQDLSGMPVGARSFTWSTDKAGDTATLATTAVVPSGFTDLMAGGASDTTVCAGGSYALTGGQGDFPVHCADGSYALTGGDATFKTTLVCDGGSYALTGGTADVTLSAVPLAGDSYALTGGALDFKSVFDFTDSGSYAVTGGSATLHVVPVMDGDGGSVAVTGGTATFTETVPAVSTQRGDGGAAVAKRSKREEDPRSAMERLLARVRERWAAKDEPEAVEVAEEAQPAPEPLKSPPSDKKVRKVVAAAPVDLAAEWNALLGEIVAANRAAITAKQAEEATRLLQAMERRRREDEDEEEVLMLLLAD
jgi:hypothetical protein